MSVSGDDAHRDGAHPLQPLDRDFHLWQSLGRDRRRRRSRDHGARGVSPTEPLPPMIKVRRTPALVPSSVSTESLEYEDDGGKKQIAPSESLDSLAAAYAYGAAYNEGESGVSEAGSESEDESEIKPYDQEQYGSDQDDFEQEKRRKARSRTISDGGAGEGGAGAGGSKGNAALAEVLISRFRQADKEKEDGTLLGGTLFARLKRSLDIQFGDRETEGRFRAFYLKHTLMYLRLYVVVGILFFFFATLIDYQNDDLPTGWTFSMSVIRTPIAFLYFLFTFLPFWKRHAEFFSVVVIVLVFVSSLVLSFNNTRDDTPRSILTLMFFYLLVLIRYYLLMLVCTVFVITHLIIIFVSDKPNPQFILIATLVLANATGGFMSYVRESNIRRAFTALQMSVIEHVKTQEQKVISENLLYSVLPKRIVASMHEKESVVEAYDNLCFLASDVEGFTSYSTRVSPQEVVDMLNHMFTYFDQRAKFYQLDKVKTIGDAYLLAGRPGKTGAGDVAHRMSLMALDMQMYIETVFPVVSKEKNIHMRIGMHVGPAVAGLVGLKKAIWDVFGDAVAIAEKMEQTGRIARVHCSDLFRKVVQLSIDDLTFERATKVELASGSVIDTWFVDKVRNQEEIDKALEGVAMKIE